MKKLFECIAFVVFGIIAGIYSGYALSTMWGWFVASTFGLPALSIPAAIGIMYTVKFATLTKTKNDFLAKRIEGRDAEHLFVSGYVLPTFVLLSGLIVKQFL